MENFESEFVKPFQISFDLLGRSHVHIFGRNSSRIEMVLGIFLVVCVVTYHLSLLMYVGKVFSGEINFRELPYIVPVVMVTTQGILKAAMLVSKKTKIRTIIVLLSTMNRTENLTQVQIDRKNEFMKKLKICHTVFYWLNILGSWQYMLAPLVETLFRRFILGEQSELLFPFSCSYPFDPAKYWTRYMAVYVFEIYSMLHVVYIYLGAEFLMITLCAHLATEFSLLQEDLRHVKPTSSKKRLNDVTTHNSEDVGVKYILKRHQRLIILSELLDEIFNNMIFINLTFAAVTICFFGFVAKIARGPADLANNFVGVIASMLPIFNLCYYGEMLKGASVGIADSAYESLWYNGDVTFQKMILFLTKRSQTPCCLTSLRYAPVTLATFTTVLSTTWSYFSIATTLYEEKN